jgi:hypothetical protein
MVVKSALHKLRIAEVPVTLSPDGRSRPPHLRTWRDGWRHLRFLLLYSPRWLFLLPGLALLALGVIATAMIAAQVVVIGDFGFDIHTMAYAGAAILIGFQMVLFAIFTKLMGIRSGWLPDDPAKMRWVARIGLEGCVLAGGALLLVGLCMTAYAVWLWSTTGFGALDPRVTMRWVIPSATAMSLGGEFMLAGFFIEALRLQGRPR